MKKTTTSIAIVGMACRLPGANSYETFWENLKEGKSGITVVPKDRWDWEQYYSMNREDKNKSISKWGGFIEGADQFDAQFFGISPKEAEFMDPRQRIMLEVTWSCFEDAGCAPSELSGKNIGVYLGVFTHDYSSRLERANANIEAHISTGMNTALIPNRISYFFNFSGPSFPINTACSSSLVAIHEAVQAIATGDCEAALAGGVSVLCSATHFISFSKTGMLSREGLCKTFDENARGYVRGEGAGLIYMKPLKKAIEAGDRIHGVIRGSAVNHGGKARTITFPNDYAQADLLVKAYKEAEISPQTVGYIEAHGTGTPKGDPIEVGGLVQAFTRLSEHFNVPVPVNRCGIGSVKTNVGHLEAVAGIAGVIKTLLSMKHKTLPGLVHFKKLNPRIELANTPFYLVEKLQEWTPLTDENGQEIPRRAGVSSFGFGGANSHVILEEAPAIAEQESQKLPCYPICLSTKKEENLRRKEEELLAWLEKQDKNDEEIDIAQISVTLLLGREHFNVRSAFVAGDIRELRETLKTALHNESVDGFYRGKKSPKQKNEEVLESSAKTILETLNGDQKPDDQEYRQKMMALMELYTKGYDLDKNAFFDDEKVSCVTLPSYPFTKNRYWIDEGEIATSTEESESATSMVPFIHPFLHQNSSDLSEQRFTSIFTGQEFFLADHRIEGNRILSEAATLEMAGVAITTAAGTALEKENPIRLSNITWAEPVLIQGKTPVHTTLIRESDDRIAWEIYGESDREEEPFIIHTQGSAELLPDTTPEILDINALREQCKQKELTADACYETFYDLGFDYGPSHRAIEKIYLGENQALVKLFLALEFSDKKQQFILHPGMMDSVLHATMALTESPIFPQTLDSIEILRPCASTMWAQLQYDSENISNNQNTLFDINLCDAEGNLCVRIKGLSVPISQEGITGFNARLSQTDSFGSLRLRPCWKEQPVPALQVAESPNYESRLVILCEPDSIDVNEIEKQLSGSRCIALQSKEKAIERRFELYTAEIFDEIRTILESRPKGKVSVQLVTFAEEDGELFSGLSGLIKTVRQESSKLITQLITIDTRKPSEEIAQILEENDRTPQDLWIQYREGKRSVADWEELETDETTTKVPWKNEGVYLITGGAGGLGLIFAREIAAKIHGGTLILTGRSAIEHKKDDRINALRAQGIRVDYQQVDVTKKEQVDQLFQYIRDQFGVLDGIIHCAGLIRPNFILKKPKEELEAVLAPKVTGVINLDLGSRDFDLSCFILFSSISGALGHPGLVDYAAANAFMDEYARYRNRLVADNQRQGKTLAIDWPLWKEGGMQVEEQSEKMMEQSMGLTAMQTETGLRALYQGFASTTDRMLVLEGDLNKIREKLLLTTEQKSVESVQAIAPTEQSGTGLSEKSVNALKRIAAEILKVEVEDINMDTLLSEYGFDSITFTEFSNDLNREYKIELTPDAFFEFDTLHDFATFLAEEYKEAFTEEFPQKPTEESTPTVETAPAPTGPETKKLVSIRSQIAKAMEQSTAKKELKKPEMEANGVAIIGMSGKFPMANDLNHFWKNLEEGKDCITEVPGNRWDWKELYGDPRKETNKTNIKWGGFIDGIGEFDPLFFGISPGEAEWMDPQQRLLMMHTWKAIEDAGYCPHSLSGSNTAIYVGTNSSGYSSLLNKTETPIEGYSVTGMVPSVGPNRISYFLGLHGPSEPVETACSSSLVAVHRAFLSITKGSCEMALAGGINTLIDPSFHISVSKAGMLCEDGRCKTFSKQANGYVRSEGLGIIFMKSLKAAEEAGDNIYGVILATAKNHGGHANSLTAPNPKAQMELLKRAYTDAGISPETIGYIEAHGTGTELGDPIEIKGLKSAFKKLHQAAGTTFSGQAHCGLGSVKTNIGHLEVSAGIAGLIKVLLQFKHKTLVKTLHSEPRNPYIQLEGSPFYIVQKKQEWKAQQDAQGRELPRRAGVSSFGFGGANAHIVLEEYIPKEPRVTSEESGPHLILLSAKNEARLCDMVRELRRFILNPGATRLSDLAYTLQVGRSMMNDRMALTVNSFKELEEKLRGFMEGQKNLNIYRGDIKKNKKDMSIFTTDEDTAQMIDAWIEKKKYPKLMELWVKGLDIDWRKLHIGQKLKRISLPTYPFAKERYWLVGATRKKEQKAVVTTGSILHPLLHQNSSDFSEQRFTSSFTGDEFFLADHVVKQQRILPGVTHLEMVRAAVEKATGRKENEEFAVQLKKVIWSRPIILEKEPKTLHLGLIPEENGQISWELYENTENVEDEALVYSQGIARQYSITDTPTLNITALQSECTKKSLSTKFCYDAFRRMGFDYGPGFRAIETVYMGSDKVLAKLSLSQDRFKVQETFTLAPGLIDSALQSSLTLIMKPEALEGHDKSFRNPPLPFALEEIEILRNFTPTMWALVRYASGSSSEDRVQKIDLDICDDQGKICARLRSFSFRVLGDEPTRGKPTGVVTVRSFWKEEAPKEAIDQTISEDDRHSVILCDLDRISGDVVEQQMSGIRCITATATANAETIDLRFQTLAARVLKEIQTLFKEKNRGRKLLQIVIPNHPEKRLLFGLSGLLRTAEKENANFVGQVIAIDPDDSAWEVAKKLRENAHSPVDYQILYLEGKRSILSWDEPESLIRESTIPWKDRGVYLITGGTGGLGQLFAEDIAQQVKDTTLILTGRSELNEEKRNQLENLKQLGISIEYRVVDVNKQEAVTELFEYIRQEFGHLNGIIHSAGVIRDNFIVNKTEEEMRQVLAPKVSGVINLDRASSTMNPEFFVLFSSASSLGNTGQADYAAANAFMDAFAMYRNQQVAIGARQGQTLAINWPLWKEGGMKIDAESERSITRSTGMVAMQTRTGIEALYRAVSSGESQVMVMEGDTDRIRQKFYRAITDKKETTTVEPQTAGSVDSSSLLEKVTEAITRIVTGIIKVKIEEIDYEVELSEYGFDSITLTTFVNELNDKYTLELMPTLFYEYPTIKTLSEYLVETFGETFAKLYQMASTQKMVEENKESHAFNSENVLEKTTEAITQIVSKIIKVGTEEIDGDTELSEYGFDSITLTTFVNKLNDKYTLELMPTIFYEHPTINSFSAYLVETFTGEFTKRYQQSVPAAMTGNAETLEVPPPVMAEPDEVVPVETLPVKRRFRFAPVETSIMETAKSTTPAPIAIVGISGQFPQAKDVNELWKNLAEGKDCITEIPENRWSWQEYYGDPKKERNRTNIKWGGFMDGVDEFDPLFFGISPREAELMDPQQRLLMTHVWKVIEDAGYSAQSISGTKTGIYMGTGYAGYGDQFSLSNISIDAYSATSLVPSIGPNRISYYLNLHGPSEPIETACSSSLIAIHRAAIAMESGMCDMAIAGGIQTLVSPTAFISFSKAGMLCEDGRCKTFSDKANGYVRGEGVGVIFLKKLTDAEAANDHIYGLIRSSAENHGGRANSLTAPNPKAQAELIKTAYMRAGIDPRSVSYIEAHGTGTELGDPIEINGLKAAFKDLYEATGDTTVANTHCGIGSIKTNIGHLELAAGIAGVIKVLLQMKHKTLTKTLHCDRVNPYINLENSPFYIVREKQEWKSLTDTAGKELPRRAGISSFGFGGANSHVVLEEYIPKNENMQRAETTGPHLIVLSAKNEDRLSAMANNLLRFIRSDNASSLSDLAYTLQVGREVMEERLAMIVNSIEELQNKLEQYSDKGETIEDFYRGQVKRDKDTLAVFDADEDMANTIVAWIQKRKYNKLLKLWAKGLIFDWNRLYGDSLPRRISLPTYPFAKERYWWTDTTNDQPTPPTPPVDEDRAEDLTPTKIVESTETLTLQPTWVEASNNPEQTGSVSVESQDRLVIFCEWDKSIEPAVEKAMKGTRYQILPLTDKDLAQRFQNCAVSVFETIQKEFREAANNNRLIQIVIPNHGEATTFAGLSGLLKTACSENPNSSAQLIEMDQRESPETVSRKLWDCVQIPEEQHIRYEGDKRLFRRLSEVETSPEATNIPWKDQGIYLITGGAGGLGLLFAKEITKQVDRATLILTGRSPLNEQKETNLKALEQSGANVEYRQIDVNQKEAVDKLFENLKNKFGRVDGIIHCAGVIRDNYILNKTADEFLTVLKPKVSGLLNSELASRDLKLDFFILFSSIAAMGNMGQSDYATANAFMDAYSEYRNSLVQSGKRQGKTISINWPLWREGGMQIAESFEKEIRQKTGMVAMKTEAGIQALYQSLSTGEHQRIVLEGDLDQLRKRFIQPAPLATLENRQTPQSGSTSKRRPEMRGLTTEQCLEWELMDLAGQTLKIAKNRLDPDQNLTDYGFDSLSLAEFATRLTEHFEVEITPALFFGHSTLKKLVDYFLKKHQQSIETLYQEEVIPPVSKTVSIPGTNIEPEQKIVVTIEKPVEETTKVKTGGTDRSANIAIIGMSGRFPEARNIEQMWTILAEGKNVVKPFPAERLKGQQTTRANRSGFVPGVDEFDPLFFEISPREAEVMDPRQRLLLQESWNALEDAGYGTEQLETRKIGMFVGVEGSEYEKVVGKEGGIASNHNGILAARLSYVLNFGGPVMAINTACSSGLVAAHEACLSLRDGECDTAIAAGVNLMLTPTPYEIMNKAGMLSPDGQCYAFDTRANGMVPGEAVVALVFRRLADAESAGDPIYAVIRGSGINYDGKTNGITAPNGLSQTTLLKEVYDRYRINPEEIDYIVTHGTGTKLGDPVEINALYDAFENYTKKQGFCALTSTKTNFGHTLAASGLVSLVSLVQALRYETIPASLNCEQENDYIQWDQSPFHVNKEKRPWPKSLEKERTGAVSSFGMSGTNAHMVVESYTGKNEGVQPAQPPCFLFALSAKTEEALREKVRSMVNLLQKSEQEKDDLAGISHTLFDGRQHFNHRCAVVAQDAEEALYLWQQMERKESSPNLFTGKVPRNFTGQKVTQKHALDLINQSHTLRQDTLQYREILHGLADLYCQGYDLTWSDLFGDIKPKRMHLPTYPFARKSWWVTQNGQQSAYNQAPATTTGTALHPLLHQNRSDISGLRFSSTFTGQEFFLRDHVVKGRPVLPGVAYLEMAREALSVAVAPMLEEGTNLELKNIVWIRPFVVENQKREIQIELLSDENGEIAYKIHGTPTEEGAEAELHSQGTASLYQETEAIKPRPLNLTTLKTECDQQSLTPEQCYETFEKQQLEYGPAHQGIEIIHPGQGQVLAKLKLPEPVLDTEKSFTLHPSMMDSALQASLGLMNSDGNNTLLPFALRELRIFAACTAEMWTWIRYSKGSGPEERVQKLDIDLCNNQGEIAVQLRGFSFRRFEETPTTIEPEKQATAAKQSATLEQSVITSNSSPTPAKVTDSDNGIETLLLQPKWIEATVSEDSAEPEQRQAIFIQWDENLEATIQQEMGETVCQFQRSEEKAIDLRFRDLSTQLFETVQNLFRERRKGKLLLQIVIPKKQEQQLLAGLSGLLNTARLESPKILTQLIEISPEESLEKVTGILKENAQKPMEKQIRYKGEKRLTHALSEVIATQSQPETPWKNRGVYLITGGAGGLGLIFAEAAVQETEQVTLILTGRSPLSTEKEATMEALKTEGATIQYKQVDINQRESVVKLIEEINKEFGVLHGIIHSAGIIRDNYILKKSGEEFQTVLTPKVSGLVNLDRATREQPLDFFVLFSSVASTGNIGQSDYSTANAFMDNYARYRNQLVASDERTGQTLSINWPLWKSGGMHVDPESEKMMTQKTGMIAMRTESGIRALYQALTTGKDQIVVMEGKPEQMRQTFCPTDKPIENEEVNTTEVPTTAETPTAEETTTKTMDQNTLLDKLETALQEEVSKLIKVGIDEIDLEAELSEYGFDSITLTEFSNELNGTFKLELTPTIFFEYPTLGALAEYLAEEYQTLFADRFQTRIESETEKQPEQPELKAEPVSQIQKQMKTTQKSLLPMQIKQLIAKAETVDNDPIAIVGISGKFPEAEDVNEFWQNLAEGRDSITEIPKDRWDWRDYHGDPKVEKNKSNSKWGGFIDGVDEFDPLFFGISPKEAELMDPQQRLLMTHIWKVVEDAGYSAQSISGTKTAIFVATGNAGYGELLSAPDVSIEAYSSTGMAPSVGPNRMSYFLNLHGPSEPIETACSSSLIAIHRAAIAMETGTCDMAIVGGVQTLISPFAFISFSKAGMLCEDGRCKTFSNRANGYVRGEGVAMLFLKRLKDAEAAEDHIYGLIRSTAENHGGKANSLTAPNPKAQADLLKTAYTAAGVDPRTISYIEAHGTGTELGDPIEINGLKSAFKDLYQATGDSTITSAHCGLGSVKTNIGHLELAAGIAGVIKVLMQLKHKTLAKTLHCDEVNPYIKLENSPFYIVQEKQPWTALTDQLGREIPRRAGVSSFGFGGANAHVVIEEYVEKEREQPETNGLYPIVLSAKNEDRLKNMVKNLHQFLENPDACLLPDLAYTLQTGREAMEERLALVAESIKDLREKLDSWLNDQNNIKNLYRGQVKQDKETLSVFAADEDMAHTIDAWIGKGKYDKLLPLWVKGLVFDWNRLYGDVKPRRISLPTYPFAKERYWVTVDKRAATATAIHPLLHQNESDVSGLRFSSTFTGQEFFLKDHVVKNGEGPEQKVLPGVAYLEMARAAVQRVMELPEGKSGITLKNVVWVRPFIVENEDVSINIDLFAEENGEIGYEIYSDPEEVEGEPIVYSQGNIAFHNADQDSKTQNLLALQTECDRGVITSELCYETFEKLGLLYGPGHQGVQEIYQGNGQVLAKLSLPDSISDTAERFVLHPSLMDSALQGALGLLNDVKEAQLALPFALRELEVSGSCSREMWALIRYAEGSGPDDKVQKLDIDLCDEQGLVVIRLKGFSSGFPTVTQKSTGQTQKSVKQQEPETEAIEEKKQEVVKTDDLAGKLKTALTKIVSQLIKVSVSDIDADTELSEYGLDSISLTDFANQLNREYSLELVPTVFFEAPTISDLADYLAEEYPTLFAQRFKIQTETAAPVAKVPEREEKTASPKRSSVRSKKRRALFSGTTGTPAFQTTGSPAEPIAIVGISGSFPMADNPDTFWENLLEGRDCITEVPKDRWNWEEYYGDPKMEINKTNIKWGGFIDNVDCFDPLFFGISPKEAELMDPQQRLLMSYVWKVIEDAGYSAQSISGTKTAIFVGTGTSGYSALVSEANLPIEGYTSTGMVPSVGPNRMSYFLNLHGPSEPVETACSSSLIAIHRAAQAMESGTIDMAIVGGINAIITPDAHISFNKAGMLCEDGRCKTFSDQANGYVRGEGVGMIFLKRLKNAEEAGDHIYGLIRSTAENHGGRANSLTAPNPKAQAELLKTAYTKAGIDPRSVGYIEAHGTGTELGDPIEINGLKAAFKDLYENTGDATTPEPHCGLGSVKTNIGHLELAAGIAGVIKVIMQLKHKTLIKTLHCDRVNPYIKLENSPFYIVQENQEWKPLKDKQGNELPRRAGVSSFGFGGANAHVVIEEYISKSEVRNVKSENAVRESGPHLIVFSAKDEERLKEMVKNLLHFTLHSSNFHISDLAYTLQVGREAMEERLALIVESIDELREKLAAYIENPETMEECYRGQVKKDKDTLSVFTADEDMAQAIETWIQKGKFDKLLQLWVKGLSLDWNKLYGDHLPDRISLPTYPFAQECHWVPEVKAGSTSKEKAAAAILHPLLHQNSSDLLEQRFTSVFTGEEPFLTNHPITGESMLPAVACLEMATEAVERMAGMLKEANSGIRLNNILWGFPPVIGEEPTPLHIAITGPENEAINYEIYSDATEQEEEVEIHNQGYATFHPVTERPSLKLTEVEESLNKAQLDSTQFLEELKKMGLPVNETDRRMEKLYVGEDRVLVMLSGQPNFTNKQQQLTSWFNLMNTVILAAAFLKPLTAITPISLSEFELFDEQPIITWASIKYTTGHDQTETGKSQKFDIDLYNDQGLLQLRMRGLEIRIA